jgi:beta-glucanase (GH16 family)
MSKDRRSRGAASLAVLTALVVGAALLVPVALAGAPAAQAATSCNLLQQLLGQCTPTTTAPSSTSTTATTSNPNALCGGVATLPKAGGGTWTCTWSDEFTGDQLDRTKWRPQTTEGSNFSSNNLDCVVDSPNNISVGGGSLTLTSRKEAAPFTCPDPDGPRSTSYTSATLTTFGLYDLKRGRVEFRAKVTGADQPGLHEAFWLFPTDLLGGPGLGEIDVAEIYHRYPDRAIPYIHHPLSTLDPNDTKTSCLIPNIHDWNTYVVEWTSSSIKVIYNGVQCLNDTLGASNFNKPYMLAITQGLGWPGNDFVPGVTPLPASTIVDYVRVYQ